MPSYEQWKYCGVRRCKQVADNECTNRQCKHPSVVGAKELGKKHPRFLCDYHLEKLHKNKEKHA